MINRSQAQEAVRDNKSCYRALQLNQFVTPDAKDKLMTKKFMKGVLQHKYWLPRAQEIVHARVCTIPPIKAILAQIVYDLLVAHPSQGPEADRAMRRTAILVRKKPPCKRWMLTVVAQLDPGHRIFTKEHTRQEARPRANAAVAAADVQIENPDGFFDGLAQHHDRVGGRRANYLAEDVDPRRARLARLEAKVQMWQARMDKARADVDEIESSSTDSEEEELAELMRQQHRPVQQQQQQRRQPAPERDAEAG